MLRKGSQDLFVWQIEQLGKFLMDGMGLVKQKELLVLGILLNLTKSSVNINGKKLLDK